MPLFSHLDSAGRERIATHAQRTFVAAGEWLLREGDEGDRMYVLRWGRLHVLRGTPDAPVVAQVLTSGGVLGELALLTGGRRAASVRAVRDSELYSVDRTELLRLLEDPAFALALVTALGLQLRASGDRTREPVMHDAVVTVAPWSDGLPVEALVSVLVAELGADVAVLRPADVAEVAPEDVPGTAAQLLDAREAAADAVVLVTTVAPAGAEDGCEKEWNRFCLRQADRVLVLADPQSPVPIPAAREDGPGIDGADLVWCSPALPTIGDTAPWYRHTRLRTTHPLRSGARFGDDARRCARRLAGRSLGLVMSGGGARALAHVGVLEAFEEAGVEVDRLGGTSVGSLISGLAATGRSAAQVGETCRLELVNRRPFADWGVPRVALIRGHRAKAMFYRVFGDTYVEELERSWFGITADLVAGEQVVHRRGPLHRIVGASMALPGLAPPQWQGQRLHTDGGVLNNLPVDVMLADGEGPVIAVDVVRRWDRVVKPPGLPGIVDTIAAASSLGGRTGAERNRMRANVLISPALDDVALLEWDRIDEIVATGRRAAEDALERIEALDRPMTP